MKIKVLTFASIKDICGFDERDFNIEETDTAEFLWVKTTALLLQLETWGKDDRFVVFFKERNGQFKRLEDQYKRLRALALNCFSLSRLPFGAVGP